MLRVSITSWLRNEWIACNLFTAVRNGRFHNMSIICHPPLLGRRRHWNISCKVHNILVVVVAITYVEYVVSTSVCAGLEKRHTGIVKFNFMYRQQTTSKYVVSMSIYRKNVPSFVTLRFLGAEGTGISTATFSSWSLLLPTWNTW